ncbi:hypothetical protein HZB02_05755 [Candidatus Woesearchaeota archaeon]|nr:hypothetical protein [Candidatus Woesearchaeota archaeon]
MDIFTQIKQLLEQHGVPYRHLHHEPTPTSEDSARARREDVRIGGKALVLKIGDHFALFVLSVALRLDNAAIKKHFNEKSTRFATAEELKEMTGLVPGSVPPFGKSILPFDLYVDPSILANKEIAFNAGSLTDSILMQVDDYLKIAKPEVFAFAKN